jgi:alkylation response protein AidB-like acyl-CoA dehydrogenase
VNVDAEEAIMPLGVYHQAASRWPHMFMTLTPTYLGIAQAAYDFTVRYLRGEWPGAPDRQLGMAVKQANVAQMFILLEQTGALWLRVVSEAGLDPSWTQMQRALAAQYSVMENANELTRLAIRTCGGQSMPRSLPNEQLYRDSRCGALMLPWTANLCIEQLGRDRLCQPAERDDS